MVRDHTGTVVGSAQVTPQPDQRGTIEIPLTLLPEPGTYTWLLEAFNTASGSVDSSESFTVIALRAIELIKNGDFREGGAHWTLEQSWRVDLEGYARVNLEITTNFSASVSQDLVIPEGAASLTLSFRYYLAASPPGQVNKLELKAYLIAGGDIIWESEPIQWDGSRQTVWKQFTQTFSLNLTGPVTLKITLIADVREVGKAASIDVGLDDVSLVAAAIP